MPVNIDNTATLHVIGNRAFSSRIKHIALHFFYVRELANDGTISIQYIPTENQLANIGNKFLNKQRLRFLINSIKNFGNEFWYFESISKTCFAGFTSIVYFMFTFLLP